MHQTYVWVIFLSYLGNLYSVQNFPIQKNVHNETVEKLVKCLKRVI